MADVNVSCKTFITAYSGAEVVVVVELENNTIH
jgi:hypothetical protein